MKNKNIYPSMTNADIGMLLWFFFNGNYAEKYHQCNDAR